MPSSSFKQKAIEFIKKAKPYITSRWQLKLISLLVALFLWGSLISEDPSLTRPKTFNDVAIKVQNLEFLSKNGYVVTSDLNNLPLVRLTVDVPQKMLDTVNASNYNLRIDLSEIKGTGQQTVPILYTNSSLYGSVSSLSQRSITLDVDELRTRRRIPVDLNEVGTVPEGYFASAPSINPLRINISGPRKIIENVARAVATYDVSSLKTAARTQYTAVPFELYDYDGNVVDKSLIKVESEEGSTIDTMLVEQTLYLYKPIPINANSAYSGIPKQGYKIKSVKIEPSSVYVAGSEEVLSSIKALDLENPIDLTNVSDTVIRSVKIIKPTSAYSISQGAVYVTIEIEAEE